MACGGLRSARPRSPEELINLLQFEAAAEQVMSRRAFDFLAGGADDEFTLRANRDDYQNWQIRVRRLVDVAKIDMRLELFGEELPSPVLLAPMGDQGNWHADGELASVRAAAKGGHRAMVSTLSTYSIEEIAAASSQPLWFQLYPTGDRGITAELVQRAEATGCRVLVLTVDTPITGNRERQVVALDRILGAVKTTGNFAGRDPFPFPLDPSMTWDMVDWLRAKTNMPIVLKGIVTREDALLARERGVDGIVVSNHGGRQEESGRSTIACLPEVVAAVEGVMPVLIDGGIRRGTDVFKALALGAKAVCIGRPYGFGLACFGEAGVLRVLELLDAEVERIMALAGTRSLDSISSAYLQRI
ncbi:MAG: alpha-hydroxy acid oxidase [Planctomycetota bacterium]|jgi:isopentenyl diphosphate isomerase/L-lactate dehydrogenase-like FMN-dependent dehydrogenase